MSRIAQKRLTSAVKRTLDVLRIPVIAALIIWPLAVIGMAVGQSSNPDSWGVDIGVFSGFALDLNQLGVDVSTLAGVRDPVIKGETMLSIDTSSPTALYVFTFITELGGLVALYVLFQFRAVFAELVRGSKFAAENAVRIRNIGVVIVVWMFVKPLLQFVGGHIILNEYSLATPGIQLFPAFEVSGMTVFIGLAMIVLSGVLREATRIHDEQELTI